MNFEYVDILLLAMIAGFIFLRLRGILGRRTGHEENLDANFTHEFPSKKTIKDNLEKINFNDKEKNDFLKGAKIAYETIITNFANGNLKNIKSLLDKKIFDQFNDALNERVEKGYISETTFIGINSASIRDHRKINNILEVTVDFVSEIISCVKDKNKNLVSGSPDKIKKVYDTWKFSRDIKSLSPNWFLIQIKS